MKVSIVLGVILMALIGCSMAQGALSRAPIKTVERLAYARDTAAGDHLVKVQCKATKVAYVYLCAFVSRKICAATYVHYNPLNPAYNKPYKVNFWGSAWPCEQTPPVAPPPFPGDGGPGA